MSYYCALFVVDDGFGYVAGVIASVSTAEATYAVSFDDGDVVRTHVTCDGVCMCLAQTSFV